MKKTLEEKVTDIIQKPISQIIKNRLDEAKVRYNSNDNISDYISNEEKLLLQQEVEEKFQEVLKSLVIDVDRDHNSIETAKRVAKMMLQETFSGRYNKPPKITAFPNAGNYDSLYVTGPISIRSVCAHHFQNISGNCWIGVLPKDSVIGLSKFNRIVHHICERPTIQEEMSIQIADALEKFSETPNVAVIVKAEHHCMLARGVREHENDFTTAIMRGDFRTNQSLKDEFYKILNNMKGMN